MNTLIKRSAKSFVSNWYLWLFPLIAFFICLWLAKSYFEQRGPTIRIFFDDGSSLQAGKTTVRYRGVPIGTVDKVLLSEDGKDVVASVNLKREAERFAVVGSKFWVVTPKVSFQGISGLETLFEGTYIAAQPGKEDADYKDEFKGKLGAETTDSLEDTVPYFLETVNAESLTEGDALTFRGLKVGSITKVTLSKSAQDVLVQVNIQNKYTRIIRTNTVFWRKLAVQAKLGLFKSELNISSMDSLLHGGIELFTPDPPGEIAKHSSHFPLLHVPPEGWDKWNPKL
jgi:paraquat-inducible protein B